MTNEEKLNELGTALAMLGLDRLQPSELHYVLQRAGVYAPAVSSREYIVARLMEAYPGADPLGYDPRSRLRNPSELDDIVRVALDIIARETQTAVAQSYRHALEKAIFKTRPMSVQPSSYEDWAAYSRLVSLMPDQKKHLDRVIGSFKKTK